MKVEKHQPAEIVETGIVEPQRPFSPRTKLFVFAMTAASIVGCIMCAFGYTKIADIIKMCMVGIVLIAFFITIIISIYEHLHDKL